MAVFPDEVAIGGIDRLDDGRMNLLVMGASRFEIMKTADDRAYLRGQIRIIPEAGDDLDATARLTETTAITFREYSNLLRELVGRQPDDAEPPMEPELLSYLIAAALNLQVPEKQSLLAEPRTDARLVLELRLLRKEIVLLKQMVAHAGTAAPVHLASPARKFNFRKALMAGAAVAALAGAAWYGWDYWTVGQYLVSTDDAYVKADNTTVAPKVSGYLHEVLVGDNERVKTGQVLARIDQRDFRVALDQAKADVAAAHAAIASKQAHRARVLPTEKDGSPPSPPTAEAASSALRWG